MEQKDYLMREIGRIGSLLRAIIGGLTNKNENLPITAENHFEQATEMLLNETGVDLKKFLSLNEEASNAYLLQLKGFNPENIELLADALAQFGITAQPGNKRMFFEKAMQLYELCERTEKTFSLDRERKIKEILFQNKIK